VVFSTYLVKINRRKIENINFDRIWWGPNIPISSDGPAARGRGGRQENVKIVLIISNIIFISDGHHYFDSIRQ
jgi:hypothetical protein